MTPSGFIMYGEGTSEDPSGFGSTLLRWDDGVCGIRVQFPNTYGTTGYDAGAACITSALTQPWPALKVR